MSNLHGDLGAVGWFGDGLRFGCSQCGDCCTGEGYVWVDRGERAALAEFLELSQEEFTRRFVRRTKEGRLALIDNAVGDCVFWEKGCQVYTARPGQCRTFPFWPENLEARRAWKRAACCCPGVGEGRFYEAKEIRRLARGDGETSKKT